MKKRYAALMIVIALLCSVTMLSFALAPDTGLILKGRDDNKNEQVSAEEAEEIALGEAGLDRSAVTMKPTEYDREKGNPVWEVEFYHENTEYDYEINANTGEILKKDLDRENKPTPKPDPVSEPDPEPTPEPTPEPEPDPMPTPEPETVSELTEAQALDVALADAGLAADAVSRVKIEKDRDDGVWVYEIEFEKGRTEYEYEIRVSDGKIIKRDIDND